MARYLSPLGLEITGILETIECIAVINGLDSKGDPEYADESDIAWDSQKPILKGGQRIYLDEDDNQWTFNQLKKDPDSDNDPEETDTSSTDDAEIQTDPANEPTLAGYTIDELGKICQRLNKGITADIWYDASSHQDESAEKKIDDAQRAMAAAEEIIRHVANPSYLKAPFLQIILRTTLKYIERQEQSDERDALITLISTLLKA